MPAVSEPPDAPPTPALLNDPELLRDLRRFIGGRVPRGEADDVLQTTLAAALESDHAPEAAEDFRRWLFGVARNKVADHFRKRGREPLLYDEPPDQAAPDSASSDARELMRWVEKELPDGDQTADTLEWMLREGAGEKLETIAKEENLPAPRVRQRVSRLRRYFRTRWAAAAAVLAVAIVIGFWLFSTPQAPPPVAITPETEPQQHPEELRKQARRACENEQWRRCLVLYDEAKALDEKGDSLPAVQADRKAAHQAIEREVPLPPPTTSKLEPTPIQDDSDSEAKADDTRPAPPTKAPPPVKPTAQPLAPRVAPTYTPPSSNKAPSKKAKAGSSFESEMQRKAK
ncbi:MAG: sigma-70 family RNA polymerase sigma factor [Myxococcales bacterium]|nr:sigma-70 family RNA polymerase sigma factor [Myxococcales bacterium]